MSRAQCAAGLTLGVTGGGAKRAVRAVQAQPPHSRRPTCRREDRKQRAARAAGGCRAPASPGRWAAPAAARRPPSWPPLPRTHHRPASGWKEHAAAARHTWRPPPGPKRCRRWRRCCSAGACAAAQQPRQLLGNAAAGPRWRRQCGQRLLAPAAAQLHKLVLQGLLISPRLRLRQSLSFELSSTTEGLQKLHYSA